MNITATSLLRPIIVMQLKIASELDSPQSYNSIHSESKFSGGLGLSCPALPKSDAVLEQKNPDSPCRSTMSLEMSLRHFG